jgi:hypothetical protein
MELSIRDKGLILVSHVGGRVLGTFIARKSPWKNVVLPRPIMVIHLPRET